MRRKFLNQLNQQVIVVTGASEGIGRALCLALAPEKPCLVITARNKKRLEELQKELDALGAESLIVVADLTNKKDCKKIIDEAIKKWGGIDVLVNNAGQTMWSLFKDVKDLSIYEHLMRLNFLSAVHLTSHALPSLIERRGRIVVVSSLIGLTGVPTRTGYSASKHALFGFFDSLRVELRDAGVSITMVAPDFVLTEIHRRALDSTGKALGKSPMQEGKIMTADACAQLIVTAIKKRQRLLFTSIRGRAGYLLKFIAPSLVDRISAKAIKDAK